MDRFEERLLSALDLEALEPGRPLRSSGLPGIQGAPPRPAAVLLLFGHVRAESNEKLARVEPQLLLTRRTETVETHKGQYAFPGGALDPEDHEEQGLITTALRETEEEVGISRRLIKIVGKLPELLTATGFLITPVVGVLQKPIEEVALICSPHEIADAFWVPWSVLDSESIYRQESITYGPASDQVFEVHVFQVGDHRIWGATAAMIRDLLDRLRQLK
jgi:8-oxo-dGTP pyrophosphatase MutT (NUDIX family)